MHIKKVNDFSDFTEREVHYDGDSLIICLAKTSHLKEMSSKNVTSCDLLIVGAGYQGVCAFEAAAHHLPQGAHVVVIDRNNAWGGMWNNVYDYVRLHQPYKNFTAGSREWSIGITKPELYLARKGEILNHFQDIVQASVEEHDLQMTYLFSHETNNTFTTINNNTSVQVIATPINQLLTTTDAAPITITASRMINCIGFDIPFKRSLQLSTSKRIHSLTPAEVLTPNWTRTAHFSQDNKAEIWVIGSGKTSMDVMYHLAKREPHTISRIRCIAGRGTWFLNRKDTFPTDSAWEKYKPSMRTSSDIFFDILEDFNGDNEQEVYLKAASKGWMHSAIPNPSSFVLGICSEEEISVVKNVLSPANEKIIKGYFVDIQDTDSQTGHRATMILQDLKGKRYERTVPEGTIIINATDNLSEKSNRHFPVVDETGLVLSPQTLCGFSGPTATLCTHAWYANRIDKVWKFLPRLTFNVDTKSQAGLHLMAMLVLNTGVVLSVIPKDWQKKWITNQFTPQNRYPMYRLLFTGLRAKSLFPKLFKHFQNFIPERFTDDKQFKVKERSVVGGNAGVLARL